MAKRTRDPNKRLKAIGLPIELCLKIEQAVGVKPGCHPDYIEKIRISDFIITTLKDAVKGTVLEPDNLRALANELDRNRKECTDGNTNTTPTKGE